jgi:hypothetical protein
MKSITRKKINMWLFAALAFTATPSLQASDSFNSLESISDITLNPNAPVEFPTSARAIIAQTLVELFEQEAIYAHGVDLAIINGSSIDSINAINLRLVQNAQDISSFLSQFFPKADPQIFDQLSIDLANYVIFEENYTTALQANNLVLAQSIFAQWVIQGEAIADLISSLSSDDFSDTELRALFDQHTQTESLQIANYIVGNYTTAIQLYDQSRAQLMGIGAFIARGIINGSHHHHHHHHHHHSHH